MSKVKLDHRAFLDTVRAAVVPAMERAANVMVRKVQAKISRPPSGAIATKIRNAEGRRRALLKAQGSAPGEPPRRRTAELRSSISSEVTVSDGLVSAKVGSDLFWARHLEFGTKKMAARPFLRPTLAEYKRGFSNLVAAEIRRRLRSAGGS